MRLRAGQRPTWARSVVAIVVLAAGVTLLTYRPSAQMFADREFLDLAWHAYKDLYIDPAGYVLDRDRNGGEVTSEGQAYALMRAAWMGDHETFTSVLEWTDRTLRRPDGLYSWHWTPRDNGTLLDRNTATDADQDIAFALVLAFHHFEDRTYLERARALLVAIRSQTGIELPNGWFPSAGNWAVPERIVNLSYFTPYAYPYFDRIDPEGRWMEALAAGYALLSRTLDDGATRLPPDFMVVGPGGDPRPLPPDSTLGRWFSFDAVRILWRVAFDCRLHGRAQACAVPGGVPSLPDVMRRRGRLFTRYDLAGEPLTDQESLTFYACAVAALQAADPALVRVARQQLSRQALMSLLTRPDRYYDLNWVWFGLGLADGFLVDETPSVRSIGSP